MYAETQYILYRPVEPKWHLLIFSCFLFFDIVLYKTGLKIQILVREPPEQDNSAV